MSKQHKQAELLLELRKQLVEKLHTQPFTIYDNETIKRLLVAQPHSLDELSKVKGFPKNGKRLKGFGKSVVAIFTDTENISDIKIAEEGGSLNISAIKQMTAFK